MGRQAGVALERRDLVVVGRLQASGCALLAADAQVDGGQWFVHHVQATVVVPVEAHQSILRVCGFVCVGRSIPQLFRPAKAVATLILSRGMFSSTRQ